MGKPTGFKEFERETPAARPVSERVQDWSDVYLPSSFDKEKIRVQASRCMDCGIPFCHYGCPLGNLMPEWNDLVYRNRWKDALEMLLKTNNFPEFTGRVCPAICEEACVVGVNRKPVAIKSIERTIIEQGFENGWIVPNPPLTRTGKKVAVVGSGPAGLACADQLNKAGHSVVVFERADRIGGLLTYGIPNFKLEKSVVERRLRLMEAEGVVFKPGSNVGVEVPIEELRREYDAICLTVGSTQARDLNIPGRNLAGIHLALEFLGKQVKENLDGAVEGLISAKDKHVIVLGGGDTGADCVGTAIRQGALTVHQFELLPRPPEHRTADMPWPYWPMILRTSTSHEEGGERDWSINTKAFSGQDGKVTKLHGIRLDWVKAADGRMSMTEVAGSEFEMSCDLCFLALGFLHPEHPGLVEQLGLELDSRGNINATNYATSLPGIFAAGDARRGQSLVVWAISEGREAAKAIDNFLSGRNDR